MKEWGQGERTGEKAAGKGFRPSLKLSRQLIPDILTTNYNSHLLNFLMTLIQRKFLVNFRTFTFRIIDFLEKQEGSFFRVYNFDITGSPPQPALYIEPISSPLIGQFFPIWKLPLICNTSRHRLNH
jgi:hypothetical protein